MLGYTHKAVLWTAALMLATTWTATPIRAQEAPKPPAEAELADVTVVVSGEPYSGALIPPATDSGFRFKLAETGDILDFRWSSLEASERKRIQKILGIEVEEGRLAWGPKLEGVRLRLKSKKYVEGMELPERALPGYRCLKTATQVVQIAKNNIESEEKIEKRQSDLYSAVEVYEQMMLEKPPASDSAREHLEYSRTCANMALYDKAIDHLEMAKAIDSRIEERTAEFRTELVQKYADQQAERLYLQILTDLNSGDNASALDKIERLKRNFPNSEYYTKVDSLQPKVSQGKDIDFKKDVIFMYYTLVDELIHKKLSEKRRVDAQGRAVPAMPGKQITTRGGHIFRGTLVSDAEDKVVMKNGDTTIEIPRKEILTHLDVDLSKATRQVDRTLAELKTYVTNKDSGLGKDVVEKIAETLRVEVAQVRDAWETRFDRTAKVVDGQLVQSPKYASVHDATYGKGSWLQDGVQPMQANNGQGNRGGRNSGRRGGRGQRGGNQGSPQVGGVTQAPVQVNPDDSDDPEVWWTGQSGYIRFSILKAFASENLFRVKTKLGDRCPQCAMKGYIEIWDGFGTRKQYRCPTCRGLRLLTRILYE